MIGNPDRTITKGLSANTLFRPTNPPLPYTQVPPSDNTDGEWCQERPREASAETGIAHTAAAHDMSWVDRYVATNDRSGQRAATPPLSSEFGASQNVRKESL
jgi:hypothetical protein